VPWAIAHTTLRTHDDIVYPDAIPFSRCNRPSLEA
jgi:hypothetical protein